MNNSKKGLLVIIALVIFLIAVVGAGKIKERHDNKKNNEEYIESVSVSNETATEEAVSENKEDDASKVQGLPAKLRAKQDVKILMLGDAVAMSSGKTSENGIWSEGIKNTLEKDYGSKVTLDLIAQQDATTATGLTQIGKADLSGYDLVILCYGYNDNKSGLKVDDVKNNYKSLVEKINKANASAMIISVLESSLEVNNAYRSAINEISTAKSLIIADMKNAFISSGLRESSLAANGLPNDRGNQIYTQTIEGKIKQAIG